MELWELSARESIRELVATYAHNADSGRFAEVAELFAPAGVLEVRGINGATSTGPDEVLAYMHGIAEQLKNDSTVPMLRHYVSTHTITLDSPESAHGAVYFMAVTEHGVDHWGRYRDEYTRVGDQWHFAHRKVRTDGTTEGGWAATR